MAREAAWANENGFDPAPRPRSYDIGIAGGVVAMPEFQRLFFPKVSGAKTRLAGGGLRTAARPRVHVGGWAVAGAAAGLAATNEGAQPTRISAQAGSWC